MMQYIKKENVTDLLRQLVSIKSPYFHEDEVMEFVKNWLNEQGLDARIHTYYEEKETKFHGKNVVGIMDSGKEGPVIYLGGHLDTVNLCNDWTKPPYEGVVEDGYLYGVGALDMKSGCAAVLLALAEFNAKHGGEFKGKLVYHLVSDEEGPYGLGTVFIINDKIHNIREEADFAIITEPSAGFTGVAHPCLCLGARGGFNYTVKVKGRSSHAATPELGINALTEAAKIIGEMEKIKPAEDEKLGHSAMCVINLRSQGGACSIPDYAEIEVFQHTVRGETQETIAADVRKAIEAADIKGSAEIYFRQSPAEGFDGGFTPYCIDEENFYLKKLEEAVKDTTGKDANISYFQSIGDFNHIGGLLGIPTVLFGADGNDFHSADERVCLDSVYEVTASIYDFLEKTLV